jgi:hypothetical protein
MDIEKTKHLRLLRRKIVEYFDLDELRTLAYDLGLDWGELSGDKKSTKSQSLISYLNRRERLEQLLILLREERPNVNWPDIPPYKAPDLQDDLPLYNSVIHNLPNPEYGQFIGREKEIAQVMKILRPYPDSQYPLVTIDGIGGIGKSTLALEVANRYMSKQDRKSANEHFEAIIWTSAKQNILTIEGIVPRRNALRTLSDILNTISTVLLQTVEHVHSINDTIGLVTSLLTRRRTLLIVDNLETIDDPFVMEFLRELPAPTKAIVTTRHRLDVAYPVRLVGMTEDDADRLIAHECLKKSVPLDKTERHKLYQRTGGVPLAIVWSVAQISHGHTIGTVLKRLGQPNDDLIRFTFEQVMNQIRDSKAYDLLAALALSKTEATRDELGYVAGFESDIASRDEHLVKLEKLSLIQRLSNKFSILPLTRQFMLEDLKQHPDLKDRLAERWLIPTLFIDETTYEAWVEGRKIDLTPQEFEILSYLYSHAGEICTRSSILKNALGETYDAYHADESRLNSAMSRLRIKIEPHPEQPKYLHTVRGRGYKLLLA